VKKEFAGSQAMQLLVTRPVMVITTLHPDGTLNGGAFGSYCNLSGSELGVAIGLPSHTYKNIQARKEFVINVLGAKHVDTLSVFGDACPPNVSEVERAGLHPLEPKRIQTPHVREAVASVECRYLREVEIGYHNFVIADVLCGYCDPDCLDEDGRLDVVKAGILHCVKYPQPVYATFGGYAVGR